MEFMEVLSVLTRWLHVAAGIMWIGLLYFYNFVNVQFTAAIDGETKKKVIPELQPRALYWFRWGAAYTWVTGFLLLLLVYYHGGLMFEADNLNGWSTGAIVMVAATFLVFALYDVLAKSRLAKNHLVFAIVGLIGIAAFVYLTVTWGRFSFRAYNIHLGAMFGTIMAANVWMRIWPAQKKILAAFRSSEAPDSDLMALAGLRSRHNTFLSVPLVWTMINAHTAVPAATSWLYLLGAVVVGWLVVALVYRKAGKLKTT